MSTTYHSDHARRGYKPRHRRPGWFARLRQSLRRPEPVDVYDRLGALFADEADTQPLLRPYGVAAWVEPGLRVPGYVFAEAA